MQRAYYSARIREFVDEKPETLLGKLMVSDEFSTTDLQKNAWRKEIDILQDQLRSVENGDIAFEYTIPRMGHRIDVVCIIHGLIFLLEFKVGDREYRKSTADQVMDYALDLKYFHELSADRYIIPISIPTEAPSVCNEVSFMEDKISDVLKCTKDNIGLTINSVLSSVQDQDLSMMDWINSRYAPTPTIIEAAQAMYRNHSVRDISRNDAGTYNLTATTETINQIIDDCKRNHKKAICFVTGVPGAGKTLAGLNIANERHNFDADEHAVFLSGNGPLVDILQAALAKDRSNRTGITIAEAKKETKAFIQIIHRFRDEALTTNNPPAEKVAIFDEAQRAWNEESLTDFMKRKKGVDAFNQSEPEFLIRIMDRHQDWAIIVCLVGGGQEIYNGEAGIIDWFRALQNKFRNWHIYLSDKMTDSEYVGNSSIEELLTGCSYSLRPALHLGVSLRSFRSEKLAEFVKLLLDNEPSAAAAVYSELSIHYPIILTRDLDKAKEWIRKKARGTERYGLLASSEGKRLRGIGIWVPSVINHVGWFLNEKDNVDSSYFLEVAASEFKVQGLEIDYSILAWDADLRRSGEGFDYFKFRGTHWNHVNNMQQQKYLKNAYRVLMTRARQGMIIFVPSGTDPEDDPTRDSAYYDDIYKYLRSCGIKELM
ncbi:DUF2075 domain-containing protein [Anaeromassilibacillus sp. 1001302B_160321_C8]|uniref:DUF2075 domain-containing protein n=2 Tax=Eubacteriales TaxID=186802 RepID=UPI00189A645A|nr:DUF2075 domain-containing protein [Anaeromassilibacillus sp. 1001302B_160321_C8]